MRATTPMMLGRRLFGAIYRFLKHFRDSSTASQSEDGLLREGKYEIAIKRVNARDVFDYDSDLYTRMVRYPLEVLAIFDIVLMNMVGRINPLFEKHIQTRIFNLKSSTSMRNLNPSGQFSLFASYTFFLNPYLTFRIFVLIRVVF